MGVGDVVAGLISAAAGASLVYQPALGVEAKITFVPAIAIDDVQFSLYDGTIRTTLVFFGGADTILSLYRAPVEVFINNSIYLMIYNADTVSHNLGFSGVQTK